MARVRGADAIYELAEQFRQQCLTTGNSLLWPHDKVWTVENLTQLRAAFDKRVEASNFYAKLKLQLAHCPPAVHKVAVDAYAFYQLPVAVPTTAEYKLARIREIIDWKLSNDQPDQTLLVKAFTEEWDHGNRLAPGLMNPGQFYLAAMPLQIAFYLDFAKTVLTRRADTSDVAVCKEIAAEVQFEQISGKRGNCAAGRNILMHLLFPDLFERMAAQDHKPRIVDAFRDLSGGATDVDDAILNIRRALEESYSDDWVDFYGHPEIRRKWGWREDEGSSDAEATLEKIADLLESQTLDNSDVIRQPWWRHNILPITRPFLKLVNEAVATEGTRFHTGRKAAQKRTSFDSLHRTLPTTIPANWNHGGVNAFAAVAYQDIEQSTPNLEHYLVWGLDGSPRQGSVDEARRQFREFIQGYDFREVPGMTTAPWPGAYFLAYKALSPEQLRERNAGQLAAEIADDLREVIERAGGHPAPPLRPRGRLQDLAAETFLSTHHLQEIKSLLDEKPQIIMEGPPGSGKTFVAEKLARYLTDNPLTGDLVNDRLEIVQFHQSYGYEDFVEGIRPVTNAEQITYRVLPGIFLRLSAEATKRQDEDFAIVIDEINRGNISRILGELLLLLEYRKMQVRLPYSEEPFSIPKNVFVLGTMNTTDRSLSVIDYALRRRFYFYRLLPVEDGDAPVLRGWLQREGTASANDILRLFIRLNQKVQEDLGEHFQIGHSYLMRPDIGERTAQEQVWRRAIVPLLEEYFYPRKSRQQIEDEYGIDALLRGPEPPAPIDEVGAIL